MRTGQLRLFSFASIPYRHGNQIGDWDKAIKFREIARSLHLDSNDRLFPEEINIIYDSKCKVCQMEIEFLSRRDLKRSETSNRSPKLRITDIEDKSYDPNSPENGGVTYAKGMAAIHAVRSDGKIIQGIPVFQLAYDHVGLGWLFSFTNVPILNYIAEIGYKIFAKYRTYLTRGGLSVEELVQAYEERKLLQAEKSSMESEDCVVCKTEDERKN